MKTTTVYVLDPDPVERARIEAALAPHVGAVVVLENIDALPGAASLRDAACLVVSAEPEHGAVEIIRELRRRGNMIAVIALGSQAAFRSAIDIARLEGTDFLERPTNELALRRVLRRVVNAQQQNRHDR